MWVVSEELVQRRQSIVDDLAIGRNYLQTMADALQELAAENHQVVAGVGMGDRMTQDLRAASALLSQAFTVYSEASQMALELNVMIEIPDPPQPENEGCGW